MAVDKGLELLNSRITELLRQFEREHPDKRIYRISLEEDNEPDDLPKPGDIRAEVILDRRIQ